MRVVADQLCEIGSSGAKGNAITSSTTDRFSGNARHMRNAVVIHSENSGTAIFQRAIAEVPARIRQRNALPANYRGSPIPPAIVRAACRLRQDFKCCRCGRRMDHPAQRRRCRAHPASGLRFELLEALDHRAGEAHGQQHRRLQSQFAAGHPRPSCRLLPIQTHGLESFDAPLRPETPCGNRPIAIAGFLKSRRTCAVIGQCGHTSGLFSVSGGCGSNSELRNRCRAVGFRGAHAVAANHRHRR